MTIELSTDLLDLSTGSLKIYTDQEIYEKSKLLEEVLAEFCIVGKVIDVHQGPVVTIFEFESDKIIKAEKLISLSSDIARYMKAESVRVYAIEKKSAIAIEISNCQRAFFCLRDIFETEEYKTADAELAICVGLDNVGKPKIVDLTKMPHLLIAGATGSGKSVLLNNIIMSLLFKKNNDELKMILVDPKQVELTIYDDIPHLLSPVCYNAKQIISALEYAEKEMERRYSVMLEAQVRDIKSYNSISKIQMPYIVIVIDEIADLMLSIREEIEYFVQRLSQKARAAGIHLILATQRPSVDVITGVIKANFSSKIALSVASKIDSRIILGESGAENLVGRGDLLYTESTSSKISRCHASYTNIDEILRVVNFLKTIEKPDYIPEITINFAEYSEETKKYQRIVKHVLLSSEEFIFPFEVSILLDIDITEMYFYFDVLEKNKFIKKVDQICDRYEILIKLT